MNTPPIDIWISLDKKIMFKRTIQLIGSAEHPKEIETFYLRGRGQDIQSYIDESVDLYQKLLRAGDDGKRYIHMPMRQRERDELTYKRYVLDEIRTFDTLYMPQKCRMLQLFDNFVAGKGKFCVPGFPRRLGFLLYGPPGTGKTTFVKALAQKTRRHIIQVSLEKIKTNQELVSVFNDMQFRVSDHEGGRNDLAFSDVIFLMEDVDAACRFVSKRMHINPTRDGETESVDEIKNLLTTRLDSVLAPKTEQDDQLNLAGLLNVLDGALDSPGRLVVMTTNHVDALDPALIRPGRVNMQINMSYILPEEANEMLVRYFGQDACTASDTRFQLFNNVSVTPAALEAMCGFHESISDLFTELTRQIP